MRKQQKLETREEFIRYMARDAAKPAGVRDRFQLERWHGRDEYTYILKIAGTSSKWRGHDSIRIPTAVGAILAERWPTSKYGRFRGVRGAARLLEDIGAADSDIIDEVEEEKARQEQERRERRARNVRDSLRRATGQLSSIGKDVTDKLAKAIAYNDEVDVLTDEQQELAQTALEALEALGESLGDEAEA